MTDDPEKEALTQRAQALYERIRPILAFEPSGVQAAVLVDLLATWIAVHAPALREEILETHIAFVRKLIPVNARIIAERYGLTDWTEQ
jgi:hypothetical protein